MRKVQGKDFIIALGGGGGGVRTAQSPETC